MVIVQLSVYHSHHHNNSGKYPTKDKMRLYIVSKSSRFWLPYDSEFWHTWILMICGQKCNTYFLNNITAKKHQKLVHACQSDSKKCELCETVQYAHTTMNICTICNTATAVSSMLKIQIQLSNSNIYRLANLHQCIIHTRSSAIAKGRRNAPCQLKPC